MKIKTSKQKDVRQTITLKENLYSRSLERAEFIGLSYPEYLRNLVVNDLNNSMTRSNLPTDNLTQDEEESLAQAMNDVKKGHVSKIDNIEDFVNTL